MKILHESATGAEIAQDAETVLDSDLLTTKQKREMRGTTGECYDFRC